MREEGKRERAGGREREGIVTVFDLLVLMVCSRVLSMKRAVDVRKGDLGTRRRSQPTVHIRLSGKS